MDCVHLVRLYQALLSRPKLRQAFTQFPVGTIYHAFLPQDLTPPADLVLSPESKAPVRLFEVTDVAKAYKQIIFASNMLS